MSGLVPPHGGKLRPLLVEAGEGVSCLEESKELYKVRLGSKELSDLIMLATGSFSPLKGFMSEEDYLGVLENMRLADGVLWPLPITLPVDGEVGGRIKEGQKIALLDPANDKVAALMVVQSKYRYDPQKEAGAIFGTTDRQHPGVKKLYAQGDIYLAGPVKVLSEGGYPEKYAEYARPADTREIFRQRGWTTVAAFQTRNPIHRSHEYLTKLALEICDGLLIHPIVGKLKEGDIPAEVRMKCYQAMLENYYPPDKVLLRVYPMEMRYAGPREAVLHAIIRQNFGCTHLIIGRDHAGVGDYYGPFEAQEIFDTLQPGDLHIKPLKVDWSFWCYKCSAIATSRTCPHGPKEHLKIAGTVLRQMLAEGQKPPAEFSRPEVTEILLNYYQSLQGPK